MRKVGEMRRQSRGLVFHKRLRAELDHLSNGLPSLPCSRIVHRDEKGR